MQKNHPKSNALRQTKICMAVAAVVTAAALPGHAVATPTWEDTREARVAELTKAESGLTVVAENALLEKQTKLDNVERYKAFAEQVEKILSDENVDDATKFSNLKPVAERIKVEVSRLAKVRASTAVNKAWHAEYEGFLTAFMRKVDDISSPAEIKADHASSKALSGHVEKSAVDGIVDPAKTAVVEAQQNLELLKHKAASLGGAASQEEYKHLTEKTFLLDANAANAEKNSGVLTWNDRNLQTFVNETAPAAGHDEIVKAATLEIGSFSGGVSDAIHGVAEAQGIKTREIATLRALDGAKHDVQVVEGALNIHQFIETEGNGALSVTLGKKGVLHFKDQAKDARGGIKGDNVTLVAGSADVAVAISKADEGAKIAFGDGTSAGNAKIDLYSGASLEFNKGSDAGNSKITVARAVTSEDVAARVVEREAAMEANVHADLSALPELTEQLGAKLEFEDSSAGNAEITNAGALTFTASDLSTAKLKNVAGGTVTINGKIGGVFDDQGNEVMDPESNLQKQEMKLSDGGAALVVNQGTLTVENTNLNELALQSAGTATIAKSNGGKATLANWLGGDLAISETQLQDMKLVNAGTATITESDGGKALIANLQDGELTFTDTKLQSLALANEGAVKMTGKTIATNASITLHGGSLDVSQIAITDTDAGDGKPENSLTIGSLTGKGDVVTGDTVLMLGELGNDDHFEGKISREAARPDTQSYPNVLHANVLTSQPVGSNVVKVGTGNLTLSGDQSGVTNLSVQGGRLTAAHPNALGSGAVNVVKAGTIALSTNVSGVNSLQNDGTLDLGMNRLEVGTYASEADAKIKSRIEKVNGDVAGGQIHVTQNGDFTNTTLDVTAAADIEIQDLVDTFEVVSADDNVEVTGVEFTVGSITGGKQPDPTIKDPDGPNVGPEQPIIEPGTGTKITDKNIVKFLAADGGYSANEQAVLASVDGVTVGDLASGKIGG
ncbi:hypothetical protein, partial [Pandoraea communis]|uniref:hypothetical protein n=1 Tax=Pandoraea communis TaxID=2508297 RepID=UPI00124201F2